MRLTLQRSGGLLGAALPPVVVDTSRLGAPQQESLEGLVAAAGFFALPPTLPAGPAGPDRFQYDLEICDAAGRTHRVRYGETSASDSLLELTRAVRGVSTL